MDKHEKRLTELKRSLSELNRIQNIRGAKMQAVTLHWTEPSPILRSKHSVTLRDEDSHHLFAQVLLLMERSLRDEIEFIADINETQKLFKS